jgi:hypothetical protein
LFTVVGDPKDLFEHCLEKGQLKTAASYLIILQTMEPWSIVSRLQVDLLERTLEAEDFGLCSEVVRYLTSTNARKVDGASEVRSTGLIALSAEEEQTFYIDILVSRHARRLMSRRKIRALAKLSQILHFPLGEWMAKERSRSMSISDYRGALRELHLQFEWPYPAPQTPQSPLTAPVRRVSFGSDDHNSRSSSMDDVRSYRPRARSTAVSAGTNIGSGRRNSLRADLENEIRHLIAITRSARCYGWCVLLCALMLDIHTITEVVHESQQAHDPLVYQGFVEACNATGCSEYLKLVSEVDEIIKLQ